MGKVIIYHHGDMDGIVSAAIVFDYEVKFNGTNYDDVEFIKVDYSTALDASQIKQDTKVYFVDYSFSYEENKAVLVSLIEHGIDVVWIDHHKTSCNALNTLKDKVLTSPHFNQYIHTEYCAAVLCYKWCCAEMSKLDNTSELFISNHKLLKYVDSWDCWKHNYPNDREFNIGFMNYVKSPLMVLNILDGEILGSTCDIRNDIEEALLAKGSTIVEYLDTYNKSLCGKSFEFTLDYYGRIYNCLGLNAHGNSTVFGDLINNYDLVCLFSTDGAATTHSIYTISDEVDCSAIAKDLGTIDSLGGGGHAKAAGFITYDNIINAGSVIKVRKKLFSNSCKVKTSSIII